MTGKVAIFREAYQPMEFREFPVPDPHPDGMMVKLRVANICGSDLHFWHGHSPTPKGMPIVLGHEMLGTVSALGKNVTTDSMGQPLREGDRVCFSYFKKCGRCAVCVSGKGFCPHRVDEWLFTSAEEPPYFKGAYAEYYYLKPGQWVYKIPDDLSDDLVSPVNCALSEVIFGLNKIGVELGDTVVIQGAGGFGALRYVGRQRDGRGAGHRRGQVARPLAVGEGDGRGLRSERGGDDERGTHQVRSGAY